MPKIGPKEQALRRGSGTPDLTEGGKGNYSRYPDQNYDRNGRRREPRATVDAALLVTAAEAPNGVVVGRTVVPAPKRSLKTPAAEAAQSQEIDVKANASKKPASKRTTKAPTARGKKKGAKARASAGSARKATTGATKGIRPGSKLEVIVGLLKKPEGCTAADVLKATGWPAVSMPQQARSAGIALRTEKEGRATRYWAA